MKVPYIILDNEPYYCPQHSRLGNTLVVFLHGLGGDCYELTPLSEKIYEEGYSVLGVRYPGHGLPDVFMPHSTWPQWLEHTYKQITNVLEQHESIILVGFSTGCPLSILLTEKLNTVRSPGGKVTQLVWLAPFFGFRYYPYYGFSLEQWIKIMARITPYIPVGPLPIDCRHCRKKAERYRYYRWFSLRTIQSALDLICEAKYVLSKYHFSVLIAHSKSDRVVCLSTVQAMLSEMPNTEVKYSDFESSNHILCRDRETEKVTSSVIQFFQSNPPKALLS